MSTAKRDLIINGELLLYGDVGDPFGWGDGFTPADVAAALAAHRSPSLTVRINSGGGLAFDGMAIYSLLRARAGAVTVVIDGVAASAASLFAMAGHRIEMRDGAVMMIHDASILTAGTADDHLASAGALEKLSEGYAGIYADRTGLPREKVRAMMKAETWLTADEAVASGFIDNKIENTPAATAHGFDYRIYAHAPANLPRREKQPQVRDALDTLARATIRQASLSTGGGAGRGGSESPTLSGLDTERERCAEIAGLGLRHSLPIEMINKHMGSGTSVESFAKLALDHVAFALQRADWNRTNGSGQGGAAATLPFHVSESAADEPNARSTVNDTPKERARCSEIAILARRHGLPENFAEQHIRGGTPLAHVRTLVFDYAAGQAERDTGHISSRTPAQGGDASNDASSLWAKAFKRAGLDV